MQETPTYSYTRPPIYFIFSQLLVIILIRRIWEIWCTSTCGFFFSLSSALGLITLCGCDCILCGHVMYDWVTRTVRLVMLRMKWRAVRWWRCLRNIFVQLNVLLIWNWCLVRTWRSFCVRVILSQVNTLWLWLYTIWSCMIGWLEWYGSSCWEWNKEQCVGGDV